MVLLGTAARVASAQPVTAPSQLCRVDFTLAPPEVRTEIEAWVQAEPRCDHQLALVVVVTGEGLFLSARDEGGRTHQRVAPDAPSAAALVMSWMAERDPPMPAPPTRPETRAAADPELPSAIDSTDLVRSYVRRPAAARWLALGATATSDETAGLRGQVDLVVRRRFMLSLAAGVLHGVHEGVQQTAHARLVVGTQRAFGPVEVRGQVGLGVQVWMTNDHMGGGGQHDDLALSVEAALLATIPVSKNWGIVGGPALDTTFDDGPSVSMFIGALWRR